ncbi:DUF4013 domain-containing protein [Candidatus Woesearchaeota archaeon]|nr:DUF4013 domain-containing protein [Candidatus Woesearchaeota archaeon]
MNFADAIKRPFTDWKKLTIGAVMYMIPIVSIITSFFGWGYALMCGKTAMKKTQKLPEWTNWGDLFVKGLVAAIISIIYFIPAAVVLGIVVGTTVITSLTLQNLTAIFGSMGIGLFISILVGLLTIYILPVALLLYVSEGTFGAAFRFSDVLKKAFTTTYLLAWVLSLVAAFVVAILAGMLVGVLAVTIVLPFVINGFASIITGIISMTLLGEALSQTKK